MFETVGGSRQRARCAPPSQASRRRKPLPRNWQPRDLLAGLSAYGIEALQATAGNAAVQRLIQASKPLAHRCVLTQSNGPDRNNGRHVQRMGDDPSAADTTTVVYIGPDSKKNDVSYATAMGRSDAAQLRKRGRLSPGDRQEVDLKLAFFGGRAHDAYLVEMKPALVEVTRHPTIIRNPSFEDARDHVRTFFGRQREVGNLLVDMKDTGFQRFKLYSSEAYNQEESGLMEVFEIALKGVAAAAPLLQLWTVLAKHGKFAAELPKKLAEAAEGLAKAVEGGEKVTDPAKKVKEAKEKATKGDEAKEHAELEIEVINNLAELRVDNMAKRWEEEDAIMAALESSKMAPPELNLKAMVQLNLSPVPNSNGLRKAMMDAANSFELDLYRRYYIDSGKARIQVRMDSAGNSYGQSILGVPDAVQERLGKGGTWEKGLPREIVSHAVSGKFA